MVCPRATHIAALLLPPALLVKEAIADTVGQVVPESLQAGVMLFLEGFMGPEHLLETDVHLLMAM